jgi:hypothetical protein
MAVIDDINNFTQQVYLAKNDRYLDSVIDTDGLNEVQKTIDWVNQFVPELEREADWIFARAQDQTIGTVTSAAALTFNLPTGARKLAVNEFRPVCILLGGSIIAEFDVVAPGEIYDRRNANPQDRCTYVNGKVVFSRPFTTAEVGGTIIGDVINSLPKLTFSDSTLLTIVQPYQLLVLGTAKTSILPNIVQGGLTPSFVQNFNNLLDLCKTENNATAVAQAVAYEDFSGIGGIY